MGKNFHSRRDVQSPFGFEDLVLRILAQVRVNKSLPNQISL